MNNKKGLKEILEWVKDCRKGSQEVMEKDIRKVLEIIKKGEFDAKELEGLLSEIREQERDEAIFSIFEKMIVEVKDEN